MHGDSIVTLHAPGCYVWLAWEKLKGRQLV